jgi:predicted methyltransferase
VKKINLISHSFNDILQKKLEEYQIEANLKLSDYHKQSRRDQKSALMTIESKNELLENEYIKISEHEAIMNQRLNILQKESEIMQLKVCSQLEKDIITIKE